MNEDLNAQRDPLFSTAICDMNEYIIAIILISLGNFPMLFSF